MRVTNQSDATWVSAATTHPHPVEVSWQRAGERTFATETVRVILPMYLERGTSTLVTVPLIPPSTPGPYTLSVSSILGVARKTVNRRRRPREPLRPVPGPYPSDAAS